MIEKVLVFVLVTFQITSCQNNITVVNTDLPIIIKEGERIKIGLESPYDIENFVEITMPLGTGIEIPVGNMEWHHWDDSGTDVINDVDDEDKGRPTEWAIKLYKDASQNNEKTFCGFEIASSHLKDHGEWKVKVRYHDAVANKSTPVSIDFSVIIARAPQSINLDPARFNDGKEEFTADNNGYIPSVTIKCVAANCAPAPNFTWIIDGEIILQNDTNIKNITITRSPGDYYNFEQEIVFEPQLWMDGLFMSCNTSHVAYDASVKPENRAKGFEITAKGPPAPHNSSIPTISDEELRSGKDGIVLVPFHSNPPPLDMSWYIMDVGNLSINGSLERFTSLGFVEYNGTQYGHSRAISGQSNQFVARLLIEDLKVADGGMEHRMSVTNAIGTTSYTVRIQDIKKGGLSGGEIAGIVIGVIAGIILIAAVVILVIRRKNLKKAKKERQERRRQRDGN